jgi:predicted dinucleotide-binding enzyme
VAAPVTIIGASGALGFGLALRWGRAGVPVVIGSRDADRAAETAQRAQEILPGASFAAAENAEAATRAGVVVLCVPFRNQSETLTNLKGALAAAQQAAEMAPDGVRVVSTLHTVSAALLRDLEHVLDEDVLVCGDGREDKAAVSELVQRIDGLRAVDCGRLEMARYTEQLTPLLISINVRNKVRAGIKITGL